MKRGKEERKEQGIENETGSSTESRVDVSYDHPAHRKKDIWPEIGSARFYSAPFARRS